MSVVDDLRLDMKELKDEDVALLVVALATEATMRMSGDERPGCGFVSCDDADVAVTWGLGAPWREAVESVGRAMTEQAALAAASNPPPPGSLQWREYVQLLEAYRKLSVSDQRKVVLGMLGSTMIAAGVESLSISTESAIVVAAMGGKRDLVAEKLK